MSIPTQSATLAFAGTDDRLWVVSEDMRTIFAVSTASPAAALEPLHLPTLGRLERRV